MPPQKKIPSSEKRKSMENMFVVANECVEQNLPVPLFEIAWRVESNHRSVTFSTKGVKKKESSVASPHPETRHHFVVPQAKRGEAITKYSSQNMPFRLLRIMAISWIQKGCELNYVGMELSSPKTHHGGLLDTLVAVKESIWQ